MTQPSLRASKMSLCIYNKMHTPVLSLQVPLDLALLASLPSLLPLFLAHTAPVKDTPLLFQEHPNLVPAPDPLHLFILLPEILSEMLHPHIIFPLFKSQLKYHLLRVFS